MFWRTICTCYTALGLLLIPVACRQGNGRAEDVHPEPTYIRDTLDHAGDVYSWGNIIRRFGEDSVWVLRRSDSLVMEKHYLDSLSPVRNISFIEGKKYYVNYRWWLMPGRVQSESFDRESGAVTFRDFNQEGDGVTDASGEYSPIVFYYEEYYPGARIKTTGYQGLVGSVNVSVGRTSHYGEDGRLLETEDFVYPPQAVEHDYHGIRFLSYVVVRDYYPNGEPKSRKIYRNYVYYETDTPDDDDDGNLRLGKWEFYDERGRTVRVERYSRFNERTGEYLAER